MKLGMQTFKDLPWWALIVSVVLVVTGIVEVINGANGSIDGVKYLVAALLFPIAIRSLRKTQHSD